MKYKQLILVVTFSLMGCSANEVMPQAKNIELVIDKPNEAKCKFLGEVIGSQGNWFTGDYTTNKNLIMGARNELRNEAYELGGNVVYIQYMESTSADGSRGTTNTIALGKVYKCNQ